MFLKLFMRRADKQLDTPFHCDRPDDPPGRRGPRLLCRFSANHARTIPDVVPCCAAGADAPRAAATVRAYYFISAPAHPGLLPRLIEPVAKLGAVPHARPRLARMGDGSELVVDLRLAGIAPRTADLVGAGAARRGGRAPGEDVVEPEGAD